MFNLHKRRLAAYAGTTLVITASALSGVSSSSAATVAAKSLAPSTSYNFASVRDAGAGCPAPPGTINKSLSGTTLNFLMPPGQHGDGRVQEIH